MATITKDVYTHSGIAPLPLTINSLYANEMGFRLVFELLNDTNQVIYKGSLSPDMSGDMTIDLLPILKYYVKPHEFNQVGGIADASSEVFKYKYRTQESYIQSSLASDWLYVAPWANENKTVIEFNTVHHFTIADVGTYISISVSDTYPDGSIQQSLSGNWILTDIISSDRIAIALPFPGSGIGFSALVFSASQIRTTQPATTSSLKYLYNYKLTYEEQMNCDTKDNNLLSFLTTAGSVKLLSSHIYPASRDLYPWQNEYVTILDPNTAVNKIRFTSDNCVLEKTIGVFNYKSVKISNIVDTEYTLMSGNLPLIDCNTRSYEVDFLDGAGDVIPIDYLDNCATMFNIGNYDCIDAIEQEDGRITIDIDVPSGTLITVPQPFTLSLDDTIYSNSVEVNNETILYVNINSTSGEYLETITFKNGWKMECRCICATIAPIDEAVVEFDDEWDSNVFLVAEGGSYPLPVSRPWNSSNATDDITFSVDGPYIQISLDGVNYSDSVIAPPSMTSGNLYISVNDISQTHTDTLVISGADMITVTFPIVSEVIETIITLSPNNITFVDTQESQPSQKIEVIFTKNNNNAITTFTVSGNYLISNTIDGVYSSSITSGNQIGNIYVRMNDTNTPGTFTGTITATSLGGVDTATLSGEVVAIPHDAKVAILGRNIINWNTNSPIVFSIDDVNDVDSGRVGVVDTNPSVQLGSLLYVNDKWFAIGSIPSTNSCLYMSEDALTWTKVWDSNYDDFISGIYYINNEYVIYVRATSGTDDNCYKSSDGVTWVGSNIHNGISQASTFNGGKIVIAYNNAVRISTNNGATWTTRTKPPSTQILGIAVVGDAIFMHSETAAYKSLDDGVTWGTFNIPSPIYIQMGKLLPNNQYVLLCEEKIYVTNSSTSNTSWTYVSIPNDYGSWLDISSNGINVILTSHNGRISRTTDLTATTGWSTTEVSDVGAYTYVYNGDYYSSSKPTSTRELIKSSDGITWTAFTKSSNIIMGGAMGQLFSNTRKIIASI